MTARHQIRIGNRRLARDRIAIDATPAPRLGEMLQLARENKGVDLYRAERDTKIRLRYLAALEDGDLDELPAAVYTKGFLRNYAIFLGLDPEEVLLRWREEMQSARAAERRVSVAPPPRPLTVPRRGLTITPGVFMSALLTLVVIGFVGFIAVQLMRFADAPQVVLTNPPSRVSVVNSEQVILTGTAGPGAVIRIGGPTGQSFSVTADETGRWSREVPLAPGRNDFVVIANDPVTRRDSGPMSVIINVPLPAASAAASPSAQPPAPIRLTLTGPAEGTVVENAPVVVTGSTTGTRLTIASQLMAGPDGEPVPSTSPGASATPAPAPSGSAAPGLSPPPIDLTVPAGGGFSESLNLIPGRWSITITASGAGLEPVSQTRAVTVRPPSGVVLVIEVVRRESWLRVVADGEVVPGYRGVTVRPGETHTFTATGEIWLRAGNAGVLDITLNGQDLGLLGEAGKVGNWVIRPGQPPERTNERR